MTQLLSAPVVLPVVVVQAIGDDQAVTDGVMSGSTGVLTSATGKFNAVDVGKLCRVAGAGAAGADLWTTITSYQSSTQVTLTAASSTAVSGATVTWGTDNYLLFRAAVTALASTGGTLVWPAGKTYAMSQPIQLPRSLANTLVLSGYNTTIRLYANNSTPRFCDFNKVADYDTFQNITLQGFKIDANNTGGRHHVVIGTYQAGVEQTRLSFRHIVVQDITTINVPVDSTQTNHRLNIWIVPGFGTADTQGNIIDIAVRRCTLNGGNQGVVIAAARTGAGGTDYANCWHDLILIEDCWHSLLTVQSGVFSSSNYQICSQGFGKRCVVRNCIGLYSGDVGVEIDGMEDALVENCSMEDPVTEGFFQTNFAPLTNLAAQRIVWQGCVVRRILQVETAGLCKGWSILVQNGIYTSAPCPAIAILNCKYYSHANTISSNFGYAITVQDVAHVDIENFWCYSDGIAYNGNPNVAPAACYFYLSSGGKMWLRIADSYFGYYGARSGTGVITWSGANWDTGGNATFFLDINGMDCDYGFTGITSTSCRFLQLGLTGAHLVGVLRGVRLLSSTDGNAHLIQIASTGVLTISTTPLLITQCDVAVQASASIMVFNAPSNAAKTRATLNRWGASDATVAVGAISVTGSPFAYQAVLGVDERVIVNGGTVSLVEHSADGSTYTTTGVTAGEFYLVAGDFLRVTYTVAPTMTRIPVR